MSRLWLTFPEKLPRIAQYCSIYMEIQDDLYETMIMCAGMWINAVSKSPILNVINNLKVKCNKTLTVFSLSLSRAECYTREHEVSFSRFKT